MKEQKKFPKTAAILLPTALLTLAAGRYLVEFAMRPDGGASRHMDHDDEKKAKNRSAQDRKIEKSSMAIQKKNRQWLETIETRKVVLLSDDCLVLKGLEFLRKTREISHRWVIAIHGYGCDRSSMQTAAREFYHQGYHVITPDLRSLGESEGSYMGMGWEDRKDILKWIHYIVEKDPQAQIVLYGVSMGGATTMMTMGEELPDQVVAAVEDCGYTSVWDIFAHQIGQMIHLPKFPLLPIASLCCRVRLGFRFRSGSSIKQLKKCTKPMLFIHGAEDTFVPVWMVEKNYEALKAPKEKLVVQGAGHAQSDLVAPERYWGTVFQFLNQYVD